MHNPYEFRSSDIYFVAYLRVAGVPLLRTEREPQGKRVFFILEETDGFQDLKAQYFNRAGKVSALTYADEVRNLKAMLHT